MSTTSQTFTTTNIGYVTQVFPVQDGVTTYTFVVNGAGGGRATGDDRGNGGGCGIVTAIYTIDPTVTQSFMIVLGGAGGAGRGSFGGGDGGGLTQVLSCSDSNGKVVDGAVNIIAGGGGGGGAGNGDNGAYGVGGTIAQGSFPGENAPGDGTGGTKDAGANGGSYPGGAGAVGEHSTGGSSASSNGVTASSNGGFNGGGQGGIGGGGGGGFGGGGGAGIDNYLDGSGGGAGGSIAMGTLPPIKVIYSSAGLNSGDGNVIVKWTLPTPSITYPAGPFNFPIDVLITPIPVSSLVGVLPSQLSLNNAFPPGLNLDNSGNIYGTPTSLTTPTNNSFVVISNIINNGLTVVSNSITINVIPPSITYPAGPFTFTVGDVLQGFPNPDPNATYPEIPVTLVLVQASTLSPGNVFPTGLIIDSTTGNIKGMPTVITPTNTYYVTGTYNGTTIQSNNITITIVAPTISYAPSDVAALGSLQVGKALPASGILPILDPLAGGQITVSPDLSTTIKGLLFDPSTGVISGIPSVATPTGGTVFTFTYVVHGQSSLPFSVTIAVAAAPLVVPPPVNHCNHGINFSLSCTTVNIYNH